MDKMIVSPNNAVGPGSVQPPPSNDPIGGGHSSGAPQDPEKRKLIQQQLALLLHAHKCQERERTNKQSTCRVPHCGTMKSAHTHMASCQEGRSCTVPHCASSRQILQHWRTCTRGDCPICSPFRQVTDRNGRGANGNSAQPTANGHGPDGLMMNEKQPLTKIDLERTLHGRNFGDSESRAAMQSSLPQLLSQDSNDGSSGSSFTPKLPAPENVSVQKEWHRQVTVDLRNQLVSKLVKAIFPSPDPAAMHDQRIRDWIQYARKVEKEMFETASDREEYYHLLAEKIYKIQKELQEKKQRRLEHAQGRNGRGDSNDGSSGSNGSSFTPKLPAPENASVQKKWHRPVTVDRRNHLLRKVLLLTGRLYKIHIELQDKEIRRLEQAVGRTGRGDEGASIQQCIETQHEHKMDKTIVSEDVPLGLDGQAAQNPRDHNESIQRCNETLKHASLCRDANCGWENCQKMKRVVTHVKTCKNNWQNSGRDNNNCSVCQQLLSLCLYHARQCQESNCMVPFCQNIRQKLEETNLMSNQNSMPTVGQSGPQTPYQQESSPSTSDM